MAPTVGIIQFPGSNCEYETQAALAYYGIESKIVRWTIIGVEFRKFGGYILPGGFSYQDRIRAGAIAAKLPIMTHLANAAKVGKPILGICNGCQILAESGIIPYTDPEKDPVMEMALAPNRQNNQSIGFICDWTFVKVQHPEKSVFTRYFNTNTVIPIPINHGEGRFVLNENMQQQWPHWAAFRYCDAKGNIQEEAPINPNGAAYNLAGLSNQAGNVFAMMPHPERSALLKQVPTWIDSEWAQKKRALLQGATQLNGPLEPLFVGLKNHLNNQDPFYIPNKQEQSACPQ